MDHDQFRGALDRTCRQVLEQYQSRPTLTEKALAMAKIEGIFSGCLACAKSLGEDPYEGGMMDVVRDLTEIYQREISRGKPTDRNHD